MKCPNCDGKGYWQEDMPNKFMGKFKQTKVWECSVCHGSGEIKEQTNEEWFCSLSTEEKAEWFSNTFDLCGAGCSKCFVKELCFNEHINKMPSDLIEEWLKQPHHSE